MEYAEPQLIIVIRLGALTSVHSCSNSLQMTVTQLQLPLTFSLTLRCQTKSKVQTGTHIILKAIVDLSIWTVVLLVRVHTCNNASRERLCGWRDSKLVIYVDPDVARACAYMYVPKSVVGDIPSW